MKNPKLKLSNTSGFSLLEAVVALGILSIAGVAMTMLAAGQQKQLKAMSQKMLIGDVSASLIRLLQDSSACTFNLSDPAYVFDSTSALNKSITVTRIRNGQTVASPILVQDETEVAPSSDVTVDSITLDNLTPTGGGKWSGVWKVVFKPTQIGISLKPIVLNPQQFTVDISTPTATRIASCDGISGGGSGGGHWMTNTIDVYRTSGNVGIGTSSPQRLLHISTANPGTPSMVILDNTDTADGNGANFSFRGTTTGTGAMAFKEFAAIQSSYATHDNNTMASSLKFWTSASGSLQERMRIDTNGRIGIGTTTPTSMLTVTSRQEIEGTTNDAEGIKIHNPNIADSGGPELSPPLIWIGNAAHPISEVSRPIAFRAFVNTQNDIFGGHGSLGFQSKLGAAAYQNVMNLNYNGNLALGPLAPTSIPNWQPAAGHVVLSVAGSNVEQPTSSGMLLLTNNRPTPTLNDQAGAIGFSHMSNPGNLSAAIESRLTGTGGVNGFGSNLLFHTKADNILGHSPRMIINDRGHVGIGTVTPQANLDVFGSLFATNAIFGGDGNPAYLGGENAIAVVSANKSTMRVVGATGVSNINYGELSFSNDETVMTKTAAIGVVSGNLPNIERETHMTFSTHNGTAYAERMRIRSSGYVGIGNSNPFEALSVSGNIEVSPSGASASRAIIMRTAGYNIPIASAGAKGWVFRGNDETTPYGSHPSNTLSYEFWNGAAAITAMAMNSNGNVGIANNNPSRLLHVGSALLGGTSTPVANFQNIDGTCTITPAASGSGIACTSDERLKENFQDVTGVFALDRILRLQAVTYNFKTSTDDNRRTGFKAQDVQKIAPEFVRENEDGFLQVYYDAFIPWITEAIKTLYYELVGVKSENAAQSRQIANVETSKADKAEVDARIQALQEENAELKARLEKIEKILKSK